MKSYFSENTTQNPYQNSPKKRERLIEISSLFLPVNQGNTWLNTWPLEISSHPHAHFIATLLYQHFYFHTIHNANWDCWE